MSRTAFHTSARNSRRSQKSSFNPHYMDDTTFTMADIFRARTLDVTPASVISQG